MQIVCRGHDALGREFTTGLTKTIVVKYIRPLFLALNSTCAVPEYDSVGITGVELDMLLHYPNCGTEIGV